MCRSAGGHGCAKQISQSALTACFASRYALGVVGVGAPHPGACGSRVTSSRHALGAEGVGATRPSADDVVRCALLESSGGRDLSFSRGRGRGGTPRGPQCRLCHTPAERQYYGSWHEGGASSVAAAPRSRVTGAPKLCQPRIAYSRKYEDCLMRSCVPAADLTTS